MVSRRFQKTCFSFPCEFTRQPEKESQCGLKIKAPRLNLEIPVKNFETIEKLKMKN